MTPRNPPEPILAYLRDRMPRYPFRPEIDQDFVQELTTDFHDLPILEEIKAFRWYYDNEPGSKVSNVRVALRRWLARAQRPTRRTGDGHTRG